MTCSRCQDQDPNCDVCQHRPEYHPTRAMLRGYSDTALAGAIRQLELSGKWWQRLHMLLAEKKRRARLGISIASNP
jgi:hypothetical protein